MLVAFYDFFAAIFRWIQRQEADPKRRTADGGPDFDIDFGDGGCDGGGDFS